jgi:hypothetical protein
MMIMMRGVRNRTGNLDGGDRWGFVRDRFA